MEGSKEHQEENKSSSWRFWVCQGGRRSSWQRGWRRKRMEKCVDVAAAGTGAWKGRKKAVEFAGKAVNMD